MLESKDSLVDSQAFGMIRNLANIFEYPFQSAWSDLVLRFMARRLSEESDKLPAIAALASRMVQKAEKQGSPVTYLAGLFLNTRSIVDWANQLL